MASKYSTNKYKYYKIKVYETIWKIIFINLWCTYLLDCKNKCGPGYKSPLDAYINGKQEKILYIICIQPNPQINSKPDYLATIDVDPESPTYSQVCI